MRKISAWFFSLIIAFSCISSAAESNGSALAALSSQGFFLLESNEQERLSAYITESPSFNPLIDEKIEEFLAENSFFEKTAEEQRDILRLCFKLTGGRNAKGNEMTEKGEKYAIRDLGKKTDFQVWQGKVMDMNCFYASCPSHGFVIYTSLGIESAEEIASAVMFLPEAVRPVLKTVIFFEDGADCYNGGSGTIWIRKKALPDRAELGSSFAHEVGHILDEEFTVDEELWTEAIEKDMLPVSDYGNDNRKEDFAEFSRLYFSVKDYAPLKKVYPNRCKAFEAVLYSADKVVFKGFASSAAELDVFCGSRECTIKDSGGFVLAAVENGLAMEKYRAKLNQIWELKELKRGGYVVVNRKTGLCICAQSRIGTLLNYETPLGKQNQIWDIEELDGNNYLLKNRLSGKYLGFEGESPNLTSDKEQWTVVFRR